MELDGFATLYMSKFRALERFYKPDTDSDAVMVPLYSHCAFNLNPRAASIDTPLHGFIDRAHVDHMHPDAVIAIAASADSKKLTEEIFGGDIGWLPWIRPGYELGLKLRELTRKNPRLKGAVLEAHGLFTWGDSSKACYETTLEIINRATTWLAEKSRGKRPFGAVATPPLPIAPPVPVLRVPGVPPVPTLCSAPFITPPVPAPGAAAPPEPMPATALPPVPLIATPAPVAPPHDTAASASQDATT
jgi:rhamnose utilization protein RhaD (predicted bifunctional aldolase and dehydrogenase)